MVLEKLDRFIAKKMKLDHFFTPHTKINSKWIKDFTVSSETIKCLEENIGKKLFHIGLKNTALDMSPRAKTTNEK